MTVPALHANTATPKNGASLPSGFTLRALTTVGGLAAGVVYLVAITYAASSIHMSKSMTFLPARLAVAGFVVALLIAALRNKVEPALWGIGNIGGLLFSLAVGKVCFGDPFFFGWLYTGAVTLIGVIVFLMWLERES